jgi:hypothetical protein
VAADLATRLSTWGTADWIRRIHYASGRHELLAISADCINALDEIQRQAKEIEQLKLDLAQQAMNGQTVMAQQKEIERLNAYVEDILTKDRLKTREINILTPDNRKLRAALEPARNWFSSVEDTHRTQVAIDKFRDAARSALDVPARHEDTCPSLRSIGPEPCNCGASTRTKEHG